MQEQGLLWDRDSLRGGGRVLPAPEVTIFPLKSGESRIHELLLPEHF